MGGRNDDEALSFIGGLIVGFMVSVPLVAWLAPRSAVEMRQALTQRGVVIRRQVAQTLRKPVVQVQEQLAQLKGSAVEEALEEGRTLAAQRQQAEDAERDAS